MPKFCYRNAHCVLLINWIVIVFVHIIFYHIIYIGRKSTENINVTHSAIAT